MGDGAGDAGGGLDALALVDFQALMACSSGSPTVRVAILDGPIATAHRDLADANIHGVEGYPGVACRRRDSDACAHGTFIAGMLVARRGSRAPAICPGCTVLALPIFAETSDGRVSPATPDEVATAMVDSVAAGARVLNLSAATGSPAASHELGLRQALDHAARRGVVVVAAAGNQGAVGGSAITRHPSVIPVVAYDRQARPMGSSNIGISIGRRGVGAPGEAIESLGPDGDIRTGGGTSAAAAFVTGAIALLASLYPQASPAALKAAITSGGRRRTVTPPLFNADRALRLMEAAFGAPSAA